MSTQDTTLPPLPERKLEKEARVGSTTFGVGVPERLVIQAAQRAAEHPKGLVDAKAAAEFQALIQENVSRAAFLDSHPAVTKELCDLIEENERLRAAIATQEQPPDRVPMPQNADQAAAMAMLGEAWLREHAPERLTLSISVQEAWEAAGGNPGIKATNAELLTSLRLLDAVCDEADAQEDQRRARGVPSGGANVFQTMTPDAREALARLERVACLQTTAKHNDDIHHIRLYLIAQQLAAAPQAEPQPEREPLTKEQMLRVRAVLTEAANNPGKPFTLPADAVESLKAFCGIGTKGGDK